MIRRILSAVLLGLPLAALAAPDMHPAVQERRIVKFADGVTKEEARQIVLGASLRVVRELPLIHSVVIEIPLGRLDDTLALLSVRPQVVRVEQDVFQNWLVGEAAALPTVTDFLRMRAEAPAPAAPVLSDPPARQDDGELPWGVARVNAPGAWSVTKGAGVTVAIVDTGIDGTHPDLAANFKGGYNAITPTEPMKDDHGHGTHVAGTIGAVQDGQGVVGVAPQAGLVGVKVLDKNGSGWISDIIAGIQWVVDRGYPVINMSLGGPKGNDSFHDAIIAATKAGVTVVCAAGNAGPPHDGAVSSVGYPGAYPEAIAVAASDSGDKLAGFSSRGPEVALVAPGVGVRSTLPGNTYGKYSGTSMASPHVAGLAALAISSGKRGPAEVRAALKAAAVPVTGLKPEEEGAGMVDAARLVSHLTAR
jgi:subtilisin family serine protease